MRWNCLRKFIIVVVIIILLLLMLLKKDYTFEKEWKLKKKYNVILISFTMCLIYTGNSEIPILKGTTTHDHKKLS